MGMFFLSGLYYGVRSSFGYERIVGNSEFTLKFYKNIMENNEFIKSLIFTSKISLISGVLSIFISLILIYFFYLNMRYGYFKSKLFEKLFEIPLIVPYLVGAYGVLIFFMESGILSGILIKLGIIETYKNFPIITNDKRGIGIIITYIWKTVPFILIVTLPILKRINSRWDSLGKIFKMSDFKFFIKVIFPLLTPTLMLNFFIIISYFFSSFETPYILGVTYPQSLAVYIYNLYSRSQLEDRGTVMAINIVVSLISLTSGVLIYGLFKYLKKTDEKGWM